MKKGLYIHIPFCARKCKYCDFVSFTDGDKDLYIRSLCKELDRYKDEKIDTIFVGGGTPTVLSPKLIERLFLHIKNTFDIDSCSEWTVEANPKTVDAEKLTLMKSLGVNRLSVGVQSFNDDELSAIGRIHNAYEAEKTLNLVAEHFDNFNIDIMSALPNQCVESLMCSIRTALKFNPTHISCYSLILEEGTPLYLENEENLLPVPDEETEREMYYKACDELEKAGFKHYEISNFAKIGYECRHNLKYWNCNDYIGAGLAAHSLIDGTRYENTSDLKEYICGHFRSNQTKLTTEDKISEYIIMTLRLCEGINVLEFNEKFSLDFDKAYKRQLERFLPFGLMEKTSAGYRLTKSGISVSNSILCEFV